VYISIKGEKKKTEAVCILHIVSIYPMIKNKLKIGFSYKSAEYPLLSFSRVVCLFFMFQKLFLID